MNEKTRHTSRISRISNTSAIGGILASLTLNESNKENTRKTSSSVDKCGNSNENPSEDNSRFIHGTSECIQRPQGKCKGTDTSRPPHMIQIGMDENQPRPQIMSPLESPIFQNHVSNSKHGKDRHDFNLDQEFESSSSDPSVSISSSEASSDLIVQNESRHDTNEQDDESNQEEDSLDVDHDSEDDEEYSEHETESEDSKVSDSEASSYIIEEDYVPYGRPISSKSIDENEQDSIEEEDIMEFSSSACTSEGQNENEENQDGSDTETESGSVSDLYIHKSVESGPQSQDAASMGTHLDTLLQDEDDMKAKRTKEEEEEEEEEESIYSSHLKGSHQDENSYSMQHSLMLSLTASVDKNSSTMKSDVSKLSSNSGRIRSLVKKGQWSLGSRIGQGAFGVVHVGMNKLNGTLMAVKTIVIPSESRQLQEDIRREIELMKSFEHKNIVKYLGCEMDKQKKMLHIFQEWVPGGSVASLLRKFGPFPLSVIRSYLYQILTGLQYLHSKNILHRDIKGGNVLVNDEGVVKLADFGASKCLECLEEDRLENMTMCGTPYFMAPEVFEENYGIKADVWSCACVAYQMCTTNPPWKGLGIKSPLQLFRYITENEGPPPLTIPMPTEESEFKDLILEPTMNCSLANLMEQCFMRDSKQRPSVTQLMDHIFFQETEEVDESILEDQSIMGIGGPLSPISPLKIEEIKRSAKKIHKQWPKWTQKDGLNMKPLAFEE